jgi:hypothetical protein
MMLGGKSTEAAKQSPDEMLETSTTVVTTFLDI